ncbi:MAG: glycerophosphodiester phosphodiesterase [Pseudomonadales bacterium]|nr:glycerophosphodiester phosphodiesterase [Pseudomonadales bacterium]
MLIYGHRGAKGEAPENTLSGFQFLRNQGIHRVELDVQLDKNGEAVVIHDDKVNRTTNARGAVSSYDASGLAQLDARGIWKKKFLGKDGIPSLRAVLDAWPELKSIQIEVKEMPLNQAAIAAHRIVEICKHFQLHERAIITSKHIPFLQHLRDSHCEQPIGMVALKINKGLVQQAVELGCSYLCLKWKFCNPMILEEAHAAGLHVSLWTINDPAHLEKFHAWGVDSIITDYPSKFMPVYTPKGQG